MPAAVPIAMVAAAAISSNASSKASKAQASASREASATSDRQFDISRQDQLAQLAQQREDTKDYREAGTASLKQLMAGTAPGGEFQQEYQRGEFEADPGYQFRLEEGQRGIDNQARANGSKYSGSVLKALSRFNSGLASQEYGAFDARQNNAQSLFEGSKTNRFNRLSSLAGIGQTANTTIGAAGQTVNSNIAALGNANSTRQGQYLQDAAESRASGYVANSNAAGGLIQGLANHYGSSQTPPPPSVGSQYVPDDSYYASGNY